MYFVIAGSEERSTVIDICDTLEQAENLARKVRAEEYWNGWPVYIENENNIIIRVFKYE